MTSYPVQPSSAQQTIDVSGNEEDLQPEISKDVWQQKIKEAKQRAKDVALDRRNHPESYSDEVVPDDPERIAVGRALNDESLQRGDIIATKKGLFVFHGRSDQPRRPDDFVPMQGDAH